MGKLTVGDSVFRKNHAYWTGGAISNYAYYNDAVVNIKNCLFESNRASGIKIQDSYGGAICSFAPVYIDNSTFNDNSAYDFAGAIFGDIGC